MNRQKQLRYLSVRVTESIREKVDLAAQSRDQSVSQFLRHLIDASMKTAPGKGRISK